MACTDLTPAASAWGRCPVMLLAPQTLECINRALLSPNVPKADSAWGIHPGLRRFPEEEDSFFRGGLEGSGPQHRAGSLPQLSHCYGMGNKSLLKIIALGCNSKEREP